MSLFDLQNFHVIKSGNYSIGVNEKDIDEFDKINKKYILHSSPKHQINIKNILFSKHLITFSEFKEFVVDTSYRTEAEVEGWGWIWEGKWIKKKSVSWKNPFDSSSDDQYISAGKTFPVLQVSWNDANEYCLWLSDKWNRKVRLPYEKEWEIVKHSKLLPSVDLENSTNDEITKNYFEIINNHTSKKEKATPSGLLWEWTLNWFDKYPNGLDNKEFGKIYKVLKGGSLLSEDYQKKSHYRFRRCPTARSLYYGFRIVVEDFEE